MPNSANVTVNTEGNIATFTADLGQPDLGPSSTGNSVIVAKASGVPISGHPGYLANVLVYRSLKASAKASK